MGALLAALTSSGLLQSAIGWIVKTIFHTETTVGAGNGTYKFQTVYEAVLKYLDSLVAAGKLTTVNQEEVKAIIEAVVQVLNALGLLKGDATVVPTPTVGTLSIGQQITMQIVSIK